MPIANIIPGVVPYAPYRREDVHRTGPGSDSGSSGNSSADSIDSSSSSNRPNGAATGGPIPIVQQNAVAADSIETAGAASQLPNLSNFPPVPVSPAGAAANLPTAVTTAATTNMQQQQM